MIITCASAITASLEATRIRTQLLEVCAASVAHTGKNDLYPGRKWGGRATVPATPRKETHNDATQ